MILIKPIRKLKKCEIALLEINTNGKVWTVVDDTVYIPGQEHDVHGVATVLQKRSLEYGHQYRIGIYKRVK